jgi:hypothetical protein
MNDFANKNYASNKNSNKTKTVRGFLISLMFVFGGLTIVVVDHIGQNLQHARAVEVASR